ncbi:MAG: UDP-N-acetylmuramoyl-tripeptide--D-alanyl-D-alanine ligase [Candidatus Krumholzibacteriales bacterium]
MLELSWIAGSLGEGSYRGKGIPEGSVAGVSIDTRTGCEGMIFVALEGEKKCGNHYIEEAVESGAGALLISGAGNIRQEPGVPVFIVEDTLKALQKLAADYRSGSAARCIGITGTAGKTETKELITAMLSKRYRVHSTRGNYNNHIGVPLTILSMEEDTEVIVVEMGANHEKEIELLASIARPEIGVITNIGPGHLEYFGSLEGVARAKSELLRALPSNGRAVLPADSKFLETLSGSVEGEIITFGFSEEADWRIEITGNKDTGGYSFELGGEDMETDIPGRYHLLNIAASAAAASCAGVGAGEIAGAVRNFRPVDRRGIIYLVDEILFVNDSYNSNPLSLKSSIEGFMEMPVSGRRWLVLGDMLELGEASGELHRQMGEFCGKAGVYGLVTLGEDTVFISREAAGGSKAPEKISHFVNIDKLSHFLNGLLENGDAVLVKGSRDMGMWRVIDGIEKLRETGRERVG